MVSGLGYKSHLTTMVESIPIEKYKKLIKIDAELCSVIKSIIHTSLKLMLHSHETCASVWSEVCVLYTNDTVFVRHVDT